MNPPNVYAVAAPSSHNTSKAVTIVPSIPNPLNCISVVQDRNLCGLAEDGVLNPRKTRYFSCTTES
jgi:hypothetical protein